MSKKTFKGNIDNPALGFITQTQVEREDSTKEIHEADHVDNKDTDVVPIKDAIGKIHIKEVGKTTQGRKGQKLPRINLAFSNDNLEYLQLMSRAKGTSITQYVNALIDVDRLNNNVDLDALKTLLKGFE